MRKAKKSPAFGAAHNGPIQGQTSMVLMLQAPSERRLRTCEVDLESDKNAA